MSAFITPVFADSSLNLGQFLQVYFSLATQGVSLPTSYTSIQPKFTNISSKHALYPLMQKAIYLDIFPNARMNLPLDQKITEYQATTLLHR